MGANTFFTTVKGGTAREAFDAAIKEAQYQHGHGGYTGSIAEKRSFVVIPLPQGCERPYAFAEQLIEEEDARVDDKWGPAGCIALGDGKYLFFGWASS